VQKHKKLNRKQADELGSFLKDRRERRGVGDIVKGQPVRYLPVPSPITRGTPACRLRKRRRARRASLRLFNSVDFIVCLPP